MENSKREKEMKVYLQRKGWPATLSWGSGSSLKVTHVTSCLNIFFKVRRKILLEDGMWSQAW